MIIGTEVLELTVGFIWANCREVLAEMFAVHSKTYSAPKVIQMILNKDDSSGINTKCLSHVSVCNPEEKSATVNVIEANRNLGVLGGEIEDTLEKNDMCLCRLRGCKGPDSNNR